ncbi:MAG: hypothetical protein AAB533_04240 [Patescibacteria group bacterium]
MKRQFGQFFTTNADFILQGFERYVRGKEVADPFAGERDLMMWAKRNGAKKVMGFDCDRRYSNEKTVLHRDSINAPQKYKFVCANPPYLHKNKADTATKRGFFSGIHARFEDLYQVSIFSMLDSDEGILIVPLNFLCAENAAKIRDLFFEKFNIVKLNVFSEQVFDDTTYNVISFYFRRKKKNDRKNKVSATIFPQKRRMQFTLEKRFDWQWGGEFIQRIRNAENRLGIFRFTENHLRPGGQKIEVALQNIKDKKTLYVSGNVKNILERNVLFLRAIDSKHGKKIQLEDIRHYGVMGLIGKSTSRTMAHLIFDNEVSIEQQKELMEKFNTGLDRAREEFSSFFLTNFRDNNRKRMSFDTAYKFLNYLYEEKNQRQRTLF